MEQPVNLAPKASSPSSKPAYPEQQLLLSTRKGIASWFVTNWFYAALVFCAFASLGLAGFFPWDARPQVGEALTLTIWCALVPTLYLICYRAATARAKLLRVGGLMLGGIWISSLVVPVSAEYIIRLVGPLRLVGLGLFLVVEGLVFVGLLRLAFSESSDPDKLIAQGLPPMLAKLMVAEARFWKWLWRKVSGT